MKSTEAAIVWHEAQPILSRRLRAAIRGLKDASDLREIGKWQGRIEVLEEMYDFPKVLLQILHTPKEVKEHETPSQ